MKTIKIKSFDDLPRAVPAAHELVATYAVRAEHNDIGPIIRQMANHFFPGTGTGVAGETPALKKKFAAQVRNIFSLSVPANRVPVYLVQLTIPSESLDDSLTILLSTVAGEVLAFGDTRLVDLQVPRSYLKFFKGPKFGIPGIRRLLSVRNRPLLLAITKPCLGLSPAQGAAAFFAVAAGGADIVKDDELLSDPGYCRRAARVKQYLKAEQRAFEEKGEHTLYTANITGRPDRSVKNALQAIELGANALMLNYLAVGLDTARLVCAHPQVTVPVLGHSAGVVMLDGGSEAVPGGTLFNALFPRWCGLDLVIFLTPHGKFPGGRERCRRMVQQMREPLAGIRPMLPVAAGGVTADLVKGVCADYGTDIALGVGGPLFRHPQGPRAGAAAVRREIDTMGMR